MKKIKLAQIVFDLNQGGLQNGVVNLVNSMDQTYFENIIICLSKSGVLRNRLNPGIKVIEMNAEVNDVMLPFRLLKLFKKERFDVVHARNWNTFFDSVVAARLARVKVVVHSYHGLLPFDGFPLHRRLVVKLLSPFVNSIFTVVDDTSKSWAKLNWLSKAKVGVIYNGVDTNAFSPKEKDQCLLSQLNIKQDCSVVGIVGGLTQVKGHDVFLKAAQRISEKNDKVEFLIIGDGPLRQKLENDVVLFNIKEKVKFLGERSDVPRLLSCMDILVSSSYLEGMSNVILEAMSSGVAVVATAVGGNPEIVEDGVNGFLIPVGDAEALGKTILSLIENHALRNTITQNARARVIEQFSLGNMVRSYSKMYSQYFKDKGKRGKTVLVIGVYPPPFGGMATYIKDMLESNLNKQYKLIHFDTTNRLSPDKTIFQSAFFHLQRITKLVNMLIFSRPNIVHMHICSYQSFWRSSVDIALVKIFSRAKLLLHVHGAYFDKFYLESIALNKRIIKFTLNCSTNIIVLSRYWFDFFSGVVDSNKLCIVENGIVTKDYLNHFEIRLAKNGQTDKINIFFIGEIGKRKGVYDIFNVIPEVIKKSPKAHFSFAGSFEDKTIESEIYDLIKRKNLKNYVSFLGLVTGKQKNKSFEDADIFILPSYAENFPISMIEAMASGLPVVTSRVGAIPEIIKDGENGFVVDPGDCSQIVEKILALSKDYNLRMSMGKHNREIALRRFDFNRVSEDIDHAYSAHS